MDENIKEAMIILIVGMTTVFAILSLVVFTGNMLIKIVNHYSPTSPQEIAPKKDHIPTPIPTTTTSFNKAHLAAIVTAVEVLTKGRGSVERIEKIDP